MLPSPSPTVALNAGSPPFPSYGCKKGLRFVESRDGTLSYGPLINHSAMSRAQSICIKLISLLRHLCTEYLHEE